MMGLAFAAAAGAWLAVGLGGAWALSRRWHDVSIVDVFWGLGYVGVAAIGLVMGGGAEPRRWLVACLVALWGLRLSGFLAWRKRGRGEDPRYAALRRAHGPGWETASLWQVFVLQGTLIFFISLPVQAAQAIAAPAELTFLDGVGTAIVLFGLGFEALGDAQLARFKARWENRGHVMDRGLWKFTRHPNYFGDACVWWGLWLIACAAGAGWTVLSPVVMTGLLTRISGAAPTERRMAGRPGFAAYVERTSPFVPWPPKWRKARAGGQGSKRTKSPERTPL